MLTLAAVGESTHLESEELAGHLERCESCRDLFAELRDFHSLQLPYAPSRSIDRDLQRETRTKRSILLAARGSSGRLADSQKPGIEYQKPAIGVIEAIRGIRGWSVGASLLVMGVCLALTIVFLRPHRQRGSLLSPAEPQVSTQQPLSSPGLPVPEAPSHHEEVLRERVATLESERSRLERLLRESHNENEGLRNGNSEVQQQIVALSKELEGARTSEASAAQKLNQMTMERVNEEAAIAAQNREIRSLNDKLEELARNGNTNKDVIDAERDLRELVEARNLHIRDVYDTDPSGKTNKAVGRVFYTEGKSLVFYAYDLSTTHSGSGKYAYYVWGNKDGDLEAVRNLGVLGADDLQEKRWKLQVSDAKVLADIDRVFVTVEPVAKLGPRPRGKKVLYAYLGGPANHP